MQIEINVWVNPTTVNGAVNIDRGSRILKFNNLGSFDKFIDDGVRKKYATLDEFQDLIKILDLDKEASYAWLNKQGEFVYWNRHKDIAYVLLVGQLYSIPQNKKYKPGLHHFQPAICFRL